MFRQSEFEFMAVGPRRPKYPERVFLAVFPYCLAVPAIGQLNLRISREFGLTGSQLEADRWHVSLAHLRDSKRVRSRDIYAAE